MGFFK